jgi:quercetin dioxygenase-like cupin family protein
MNVHAMELAPEAQRAWDLVGEAHGGHTARTLLKLPGLRLVLLALKANGKIPEHAAETDLTLQAILGRAVLTAHGESHLLTPGRIVAVEKHVPHAVRAELDSELLLTLSWPGR